MGIFEIDDPDIDVEALEERVRAAIEAKRGVRFTDEELRELRQESLEPRLRREDLPRGWFREMSAVREHLPEVEPPPGIHLSPPDALYRTGSAGLKGKLLRLLRLLFRPFYRATLNLEPVLGQMIETTNDQGAWAGRQLSEMTGRLDRWRERDLHLSHNLVYELTDLKVGLEQMQDRINELTRRLDALKERERALERLTVPTGDGDAADRGDAGHAGEPADPGDAGDAPPPG